MKFKKKNLLNFIYCLKILFTLIFIYFLFYKNKEIKIFSYKTEANSKEKFYNSDKICNLYVENKEEIKNILKKKINSLHFKITEDNIPSYNEFHKFSLNIKLKNPENGLLGVYFDTTFGYDFVMTSFKHYQYSLEEILNNFERYIKKAYLFWDINCINKKNHDFLPEKDFQIADIFHVSIIINDENKIKESILNQIVQNYLFNQGITKDRILIKRNSYNAIEGGNIDSKLPESNCLFNNKKIEYIFFDGGNRLINEKKNDLDYLLNKRNYGVKRIYLFSVSIQKEKKYEFEYKNITNLEEKKIEIYKKINEIMNETIPNFSQINSAKIKEENFQIKKIIDHYESKEFVYEITKKIVVTNHIIDGQEFSFKISIKFQIESIKAKNIIEKYIYKLNEEKYDIQFQNKFINEL
ncbi:hypothetical protein [Candidatus Phytoplasma sacchari]|nr:hypothetical protein [Candidatus Phytoplasma sacchari]KAB8122677.1 hypothetical protein F2B49_01185 [Candidatus Phytoplasma sacchari]